MFASAQCDGGNFQNAYMQTLQGFGHRVFSGKSLIHRPKSGEVRLRP